MRARREALNSSKNSARRFVAKSARTGPWWPVTPRPFGDSHDRTDETHRLDRRSHDRDDARPGRPLQPGLRRRHLQHRGLSGAPRSAGRLRHRARRRPLFRPDRLARRRRGHRHRSDRARAGPPARPVPDRNRCQGRAQLQHYWRDNAPARELFELPDWSRIAESIIGARIVYFSGITLSIYSNQRARPFPRGAGNWRAKAGAKVVFDGNYRPRAWKGDMQRTRTVFMEALKRVDIALPTYR